MSEKPRDVGAGVANDVAAHTADCVVQADRGVRRHADAGLVKQAALVRRGDDARAQGLGEHQGVPRTLAPALARSPSKLDEARDGEAVPGSWSLMEWPPATTQPASWQQSAPPAGICPRPLCPGSWGKHSRLSASLGSPPMAWTSESAFAAATWPNRKGWSTMGGKKSSLHQAATVAQVMTHASSEASKPTSRLGSSVRGKVPNTLASAPGAMLPRSRRPPPARSDARPSCPCLSPLAWDARHLDGRPLGTCLFALRALGAPG